MSQLLTPDQLFDAMKERFFVMAGPNVIESEEQVLETARALKEHFAKTDYLFIFKTSFDKANRSSLQSYRGLGMERGLEILRRVREELGIPVVTDIHESSQAQAVARVADVVQIPAFLCRQTDLLVAAAETGRVIHVKKAQFASSEVVHQAKNKLFEAGNPRVVLCERGSMYGYQDLTVDFRQLKWLKSPSNLVSMDVTHCLQVPAQKMPDGRIQAGGYRELIPLMGRLAVASEVDGLFMEVHPCPEQSRCDAPTQFPLELMPHFLEMVEHYRRTNLRARGAIQAMARHLESGHSSHDQDQGGKILLCIPARYRSTRLPGKPLLKLGDQTVIERVHRRACQTRADRVVVLTDDRRIVEEVERCGGEACLIEEECLNGTERVVRYLQRIDHRPYRTVVNLQGDEPFVDPDHVDRVIEQFDEREMVCSTLCSRTRDRDEIASPNRGKCVVDQRGYITYCSRQPIPVDKRGEIASDHDYLIHQGVFAFSKDYLLNGYSAANTPNQLIEDIEWLKIIEQGHRIKALIVDRVERGIDTYEDYHYLGGNLGSPQPPSSAGK
jgi:2-dehydro-3-deoxyphosphooctonate aldolase (KDO 8-P synthase)